KREVLRLVRRIAPVPDVPASVEPLGPPPVGIPIPRTPTWEQFMEALSGPVRELEPGDRPKEWITNQAPEDDSDLAVPQPPAAEREPAPLPPVPERYKVQFTAGQEYVDLLQQARDLSSHALPNGAIEQLHLQAMRLLVAQLKKRRCAEVKRPRDMAPDQRQQADQRQCQQADQRQRQQADQRQCQQGSPPVQQETPRQRQCQQADQRQRQQGSPPVQQETPRQRQRQEAPRRRESVRAAVKREVWQRDGARCTYVDGRTRCRETAFLQLHHVNPHAKGGPPSAANLTLRCHAHNALAAEQDFGRDFVRAKRDARGRGSMRSSVAPK